MEFTLGQAVRWSHPLHRVVDYKRNMKVWTDDPYPSLNRLSPGYQKARGEYRNGIIVGKRALSDGWVLGYGHSGYKSARTYTAYLIAFDLHRKPVYVLPEYVIPVGGCSQEEGKGELL